jgi:hypothetical protein
LASKLAVFPVVIATLGVELITIFFFGLILSTNKFSIPFLIVLINVVPFTALPGYQ